jgi:5-methylcytosine-specific restriction endonuclease McrA
MAKQPRRPVPTDVQVKVLFRDKWLCHVCRRPLVFSFAMKHLAELVAQDRRNRPPAYYNLNFRRDSAPLLDELAACIDHVKSLATGGDHHIDNFAAICARCNARKGTSTREEFIKASTPWRVKGKYGEPLAWDGLSSVFISLASKCQRLTSTEKRWLAALLAYREL